MGSQQLLLIVVGVVIVGIMVAVGMTLFADQATSTNRDELVDDLAHYATIARAYYRRPQAFGGGGNSFQGLTMARITSQTTNQNGVYTLSPDPANGGVDHVTLTGVGTEVGLDGTTNVKVVMLVYADSAVVDEASIN
jgi:Tfp pilus assembly protein FimT